MSAPRRPRRCGQPHCGGPVLAARARIALAATYGGTASGMPCSGAGRRYTPEMPALRPKAFFTDGCSYDAATEKLTVEFTVFRKRVFPLNPSGKPYKYIYDEIPLATSEAFLNDAENGEYYNASIRGLYTFTRIE
mgnify:CR=1 FL=1